MHARAGVIILCLVLFLLPNICTIKNILRYLFSHSEPGIQWFLAFGELRTIKYLVILLDYTFYILKTKDLFDGGRVILFLLDICCSMLW